MLFSSVEFILVFLPLFLIIYYLTPAKYKNYILFAASLIFYAYGGLKDLALLVLSLIVNYLLAKCIGEWRKDSIGKIILTASVILNVSVLGIYKYGSFILEAIGKGGDYTITGFGSLSAMPLGLSFYTFQILSYLIDMYRGEIPQDVTFSKFATYVSMFPRLVQGPMFQYSKVERALEGRHITAYDLQNGLKVFTIGLAAKVLLADRIGLLWRDIQVTGIVSISTGRAWLGMIAYSLQLYFDFCGYSIMAVGVGRMLGFELPANFDSPYMSKSIREFYRRWHITLGEWFKKYVYIPLGGSRNGTTATIINLGVVWLFTGMWHGSTFNFIIWAAILYICIVLERILGDKLSGAVGGISKKNIGYYAIDALKHLYVLVIIGISWVCFALPNLSELFEYLGRLFGFVKGVNIRPRDFLTTLGDYWYILLGCIVCSTGIVGRLYDRYRESIVCKLILAALFWFCVWRVIVEGNNTFMYSKF